MSQYLLPLTNAQKQQTVELLALIFNDNEFLPYASKVNGPVVDETEKVMNDLIFCTRAITGLFSAIRCVPKSPNIYGWLVGCMPGLIDIVKANSKTLYTNDMCLTVIRLRRDRLKEFLVLP